MNKAIKGGGIFNKEILVSYHNFLSIYRHNNLRRMLDEYEKSL